MRLIFTFSLASFLILLFYITGSLNNSPATSIILAVLYLFVILLAYFRFRHPITFYSVGLKIAPKSAFYYNNRGLAYLRRGMYERARQDFDYAIILNPKSVRLYLSRGTLSIYMQNYAQALQDLNRALHLKPDLLLAYNNRGTAYIRMHEYDLAIQDYNQALALKPRYYPALLGRSLAYLKLKDLAHAREDWEAANAIKPRSIVVKSMLGDIYFASREYEQAVKAFGNALALPVRGTYLPLKQGVVSFKATPLVNRSLSYCALQDYQKALQDAEQAVSLAPGFWGAYGSRAMAQLGLGNLSQARTDIARSWELSQESCLFGLLLAWVELCFTQPDEALIEHLQAVSEIESQHYCAFICRGVALWLQGKSEEALYILEQVNILESTRWEIYFWIGMIEISLGFDQEGLGALNRSIDLGIPVGLLTPLNQFQQKRPEFFARYVAGLLNSVME